MKAFFKIKAFPQSTCVAARDVDWEAQGCPCLILVYTCLEVLLNSKLQTLHSVVEAQRSKVPNCKVMYHEMEASPEEKVPGMFKCLRKNDV